MSLEMYSKIQLKILVLPSFSICFLVISQRLTQDLLASFLNWAFFLLLSLFLSHHHGDHEQLLLKKKLLLEVINENFTVSIRTKSFITYLQYFAHCSITFSIIILFKYIYILSISPVSLIYHVFLYRTIYFPNILIPAPVTRHKRYALTFINYVIFFKITGQHLLLFYIQHYTYLPLPFSLFIFLNFLIYYYNFPALTLNFCTLFST
mmetsp:Transcript_10977/g.15152  ORF Transcript_10977/g.15152 Transcript_10977/m.15152 type:complete len:207 (+) Transcript_10977:1018-1638(+)